MQQRLLSWLVLELVFSRLLPRSLVSRRDVTDVLFQMSPILHVLHALYHGDDPHEVPDLRFAGRENSKQHKTGPEPNKKHHKSMGISSDTIGLSPIEPHFVRKGCAGQFYFSFWRSNLVFVRKGCAGHLEIEILLQFLTIEPCFVRKSSGGHLLIAILR